MTRIIGRGDIVTLISDTKADPDLWKVERKSLRTGSLTIRSRTDGSILNVQHYDVKIQVYKKR